MKQDGCFARPCFAAIPDSPAVFCKERVSADDWDVPISLREDKLNVIVSGRSCHDVHQKQEPCEWQADSAKRASLNPDKKEGKERVEPTSARRNISKKTNTKSLKELFEEGEGELSAGELS